MLFYLEPVAAVPAPVAATAAGVGGCEVSASADELTVDDVVLLLLLLLPPALLIFLEEPPELGEEELWGLLLEDWLLTVALEADEVDFALTPFLTSLTTVVALAVEDEAGPWEALDRWEEEVLLPSLAMNGGLDSPPEKKAVENIYIFVNKYNFFCFE